MQLFLEYAKSASHEELKVFGLLRGVTYFAWNSKNFLLLVNVSVACERFYAALRDAETKCTRAIAAIGDLDICRMCKNVVRLNRATSQRMSAYNQFSVGAALPLRFVSAAVAYVVVLLQFALL
ncbi:uncharacterized protein LOC133530320 [Cydia pomonella]|uniref:uncharacterized protein LOC133530320 n=1 Tax=Cydia pomonella TaxID=82600 RepID=UPI002ADD39E5|nr:uncharacterized protein LOC133530320 [Cydia pomonella]